MSQAAPQPRDHGGGLDDAARRYGGRREDWLDLSTGINPRPYPVPDIPPGAWTALPDTGARDRLERAARAFWSVPEAAAVLAAPGASALIAGIPRLLPAARARIPARTYNEHAASFRAAGWDVVHGDTGPDTAEARVVVHPNNPTGALFSGADEPAARPLLVIDESFGEVIPAETRVPDFAARPGTLILKSLGKFWGLAGLRLGFVIGDPRLVAALKERLGPWPVSGIAQHVGAAALEDQAWAGETRQVLAVEAARLDALMRAKGADPVGGTDLFRLYRVDDAARWQARLAGGRVWSRIFPYEPGWLRLGLPPADGWAQLEAALG